MIFVVSSAFDDVCLHVHSWHIRWLLYGVSYTAIFHIQVVGDRKGAIFGGLVEAPLRPTNNRYQVMLEL